MGRICHAKNCFSKSKRKEDNVQFHRIPSDTEIRKKWIELCQVPSKFHSFKTLHICSKHFKSSDYCLLGTKTVLKKNALPSVFYFKCTILDKIRFSGKKLTHRESDKEIERKANEINEIDSLIKDEINVHSSQVDETIKKINSIEDKIGITDTFNIITEIKTEPVDDNLNPEIDIMSTVVKTEPVISSEGDQIKDLVEKEARIIEILEAAHVKIEIPVALNYSVGQSIELNHFDDKWYNGVVLQIDDDENEILVEFEKHSKSHKEWIRMDSDRLRMYGKIPNELSKESKSDKIEEVENSDDEVGKEECGQSEEKEEFNVSEDYEKESNTSQEVQNEEDLYTIIEIPIFIGQKIELYDFNNWYIAVIVEIDNNEEELLLEYEKSSKRHAEWIPMNSKRIRVTDDSETML